MTGTWVEFLFRLQIPSARKEETLWVAVAMATGLPSRPLCSLIFSSAAFLVGSFLLRTALVLTGVGWWPPGYLITLFTKALDEPSNQSGPLQSAHSPASAAVRADAKPSQVNDCCRLIKIGATRSAASSWLSAKLL